MYVAEEGDYIIIVPIAFLLIGETDGGIGVSKATLPLTHPLARYSSLRVPT